MKNITESTGNNQIVSFHSQIKRLGLEKLQRESITTLQVNLGKLCNLACLHCHVEAGPKRTEIMQETTIRKLIQLIDNSSGIKCVDLTGGAPEMNPYFKELIKELAARNLEIIDRSNLTIFFEEDYKELPEFLAEHRVHIIASLPCYSKANVDKQRGKGVFNKSIEALILLNSLGYGHEESLKLDLVYNPLGASLPPSQGELESTYKKELKDLFGIVFNNLYTITNMPIKRFLHVLKRDRLYIQYMNLLSTNFNNEALKGVMCKHLISVGWEGQLYDCDFNQMLELLPPASQKTLWNIESFDVLVNAEISIANHCYGCTAGSGSSCTGTLADRA